MHHFSYNFADYITKKEKVIIKGVYMKCRWKHCRYGGEVDREDAVRVGELSYYHKECYEEMKSIQAIVDLYHERVDAHPVENWLRKAVNDLVFKENNSAKYVLFSFKYCLNDGWKPFNPSCIKYAVKNSHAKQAWDKEQSKQKQIELKEHKKNEMNDYHFTLDLPSNNPAFINDSKSKFNSILVV